MTSSTASSLADYFDQFVRERTYLNNVTPKTRGWYQTAWSTFLRAQADALVRQPTAPLLALGNLQHFVLHLRERGVTPISCNCWVQARGWEATQFVEHEFPARRTGGHN